jgi:hypothetical protein
MSLKKSVDEVLEKPMDRRQFLANAGAALLTLVGVTAILKSFGLHDTESRRSNGYGGGSYGGK